MRFKFMLANTVLIGVLLAGFASGCQRSGQLVYLTWQGDTSHTMTVNYHTARAPEQSTVYYDLESRDGELEAYQFQTQGTAWQIPGLRDRRYVNSVELTELEAGATYYFVAGDEKNGFSKEKKFRTIPNDGSDLRFVSGGDISILLRAKRILRQAAAYDPMFVKVGGDLAYADGRLDKYYYWDIYLRRWADIMVTSDDVLIPMVLAIGNHEVNDLEGPPELRAPFFFGYFPQGGSTYFTRTFGPDVAVIVLDTDHIVPHEEQRDWLEEQLQAHAHYPYRMAMYHVPLYPSHRPFEDSRSEAAREHWLPLFDEYRLPIAFENHDHTFKRTHRLRGNELDPEGTLYVGDGSMGVRPRRPDPDRWYLERAAHTPHFWVVETSGVGIQLYAVDEHGDVFDAYMLPREEMVDARPAAAE